LKYWKNFSECYLLHGPRDDSENFDYQLKPNDDFTSNTIVINFALKPELMAYISTPGCAKKNSQGRQTTKQVLLLILLID